jgi:uncharacterized protein YhbP (UPF0306 family)
MTREKLERIVVQYMDSMTTMTLAGSMDEKPWAAAVYYARRVFDLIFFSSPSSRHSMIFGHNPRAAATIHGDYKGWQEIKGLQMEGEIKLISGATARAKALATYLKRYPFVREFLSDSAGVSLSMAKKVAGVELYNFRPERIFYMDNSYGFGNRWKLEIRNGQIAGDPVKE